MNALIINCSPVRDGATAEIVRLVSESLYTRFETKAVIILRFAKAAGVVIKLLSAFNTTMWKS